MISAATTPSAGTLLGWKFGMRRTSGFFPVARCMSRHMPPTGRGIRESFVLSSTLMITLSRNSSFS